MKNQIKQYLPLPYSLFTKLPEKIQAQMIDEVISGIEFVRGGTTYTPETFREGLEMDRYNQFHFEFKVDTFGIHGTMVSFTFSNYFSETYTPSEVEDWVGFKVYETIGDIELQGVSCSDFVLYYDTNKSLGFEAQFNDGEFNSVITNCENIGDEHEDWNPVSNKDVYEIIKLKAIKDFNRK